jgi:DNA-binding transcriptional MocR family regulator
LRLSFFGIKTFDPGMPPPDGHPALYEQVADKIEKLIRSGAMRAGERIPSVRRASAQHGVSVPTVVQAYISLENRGLIEARPKSGFFVRSRLRADVSEPKISRPAKPAALVGIGNLQTRVFDAARMPDVVAFGAAYPGPENLPVIAVESPAYFGVLQTIEEQRLRALEIPMHPRDGMDLDFLERAMKNRRVAACLATPNFNNPLGSLMPDANKRRLVEILARREVPLIEDDVNGSLAHNGTRPRVAQSYDTNGLVLLCGSISKTIAPGYRVGWVAPGRYYEKVKALKITSTLATGSLPQLAIAEFMANGGFDHHLRALRRNFAAQIQTMREAIAEAFPPEIKLTRPSGGFVLWIELPPKVSALELHERALAQKISIAPGPMFSAKQDFRNFIRINCGHAWTSRLEQAVGTLGRMVRKMA